MTTSAVNSLIYQSEGSMQAAAAGFVVLSIVVVSYASTHYLADSNIYRSSGSSTSARARTPAPANTSISSP
jgi:hypothetical protein